MLSRLFPIFIYTFYTGGFLFFTVLIFLFISIFDAPYNTCLLYTSLFQTHHYQLYFYITHIQHLTYRHSFGDSFSVFSNFPFCLCTNISIWLNNSYILFQNWRQHILFSLWLIMFLCSFLVESKICPDILILCINNWSAWKVLLL